MAKKISFGSKPSPKADLPTPDEWVNTRQSGEGEPMKRLTIDVVASLHARIKSQCALKGVQMNDAIRELLEKHFPPNG